MMTEDEITSLICSGKYNKKCNAQGLNIKYDYPSKYGQHHFHKGVLAAVRCIMQDDTIEMWQLGC